MNTKEKGARFEREVKHYLEQKGFFVIRQSASKFPDLLAVKKHRYYAIVYAIECKCNKKSFTKQEKINLLILSNHYRIVPVLAYKENGKIKFLVLERFIYDDTFKQEIKQDLTCKNNKKI